MSTIKWVLLAFGDCCGLVGFDLSVSRVFGYGVKRVLHGCNRLILNYWYAYMAAIQNQGDIMTDGALIPKKKNGLKDAKPVLFRVDEAFRDKLIKAVLASGKSAAQIIRDGTLKEIKRILG